MVMKYVSARSCPHHNQFGDDRGDDGLNRNREFDRKKLQIEWKDVDGEGSSKSRGMVIEP